MYSDKVNINDSTKGEINMFVQTRTNTFETNSSSTHSFCVFGGQPVYEVVLPDEDGKLRLSVSETEFGWGHERYSDFRTKVGYILLDLVGSNHWGDNDSVNLERVENELNTIRRVVSRQTGIAESDILFEIPKRTGYIDHQSIGTGRSEIFDSDRLRDIFFRGDVYLNISNDNGYGPEDDYSF